MGHKWDYSCPQDVFAEITQVAPAFAGLSYARVEQEGIPWPCPKPDHPGTPILHQNGPARGKGIFSAIAHKGAQETPDSEYPLLLTTGRNLFHYHTGTMSRNASGLAAQRDTELMEISFADAQALDLVSGSKVKDRKSTRLNSSHVRISYAVYCVKKKKIMFIVRKHT